MIGIIAAVSSNGVVGKNGILPWSYPEDLKYFKQQTLNSVVIMGRATFESMGSKPLPKRTNIVISSQDIKHNGPIVKSTSLIQAIGISLGTVETMKKDIWLIGGTNIWREGMSYADSIHLTLIPKIITGNSLTFFPWIDPQRFKLSKIEAMPSDGYQSDLKIAIYNRH